MLWGGRGTANKYHWRVWGALAVFRPHWVCPHSRCVCFPRLHCSGSRLLYRERALSCMHFPGLSCWVQVLGYSTKAQTRLGLRLLCLPGSEHLRQPGTWRVHSLQVQCALSPPRPSLSFLARLVRWALCLFWGADLWLWPSRQKSSIQNLRKSLVRSWKPVCSLVEDALSGAEFAPFWLWLVPASPLPLVGHGLVHSPLALLWYCSVLCSVNGPAVP